MTGNASFLWRRNKYRSFIIAVVINVFSAKAFRRTISLLCCYIHVKNANRKRKFVDNLLEIELTCHDAF